MINRCTCTADHCYWDTSDHPVESGDLCLHCHFLDFNEMCPAREEAELTDGRSADAVRPER